MKICDYAGNVHIVRKYVISNDGEESVWSNTWYGRHVIGNDCKWVIESKPQSESLPDSEIILKDIVARFGRFLKEGSLDYTDNLVSAIKKFAAASTVPDTGATQYSKGYEDGMKKGKDWQKMKEPLGEDAIDVWEQFIDDWDKYAKHEHRLGNNASVGEFYEDNKSKYQLYKQSK